MYRGTWCPNCAGNARQTLETAKAVAELRGGRCLSLEFKSCRTKLEWQCGFGHTWMAALTSLKDSQTWCPTCAGKQPLGLDFANELATQRGGMCLSMNYVNSLLPMLWRCRLVHEWTTSLSSLKHSGTWCPACAGTQRLDWQKNVEGACFLQNM